MSNEKHFVYNGYKQIAEYAGATATMLTVWQPESSGDFDVPLWSKTGTEVQMYIVDGNKNIRQLKNATGIGNVTSTGTPFPWQFSSEYRDAETGLVYYNYRYYAPTIGRWINRDPIGEIPLYVFLYNNSNLGWDKNGLTEDNLQNCCGTDVTKELDTLITTIIERLKADEYRNIIYDICMFDPGAGWDMEPFQSDGNHGKAGSKCSATRTYHEKCYKSTSMNYILWGLLTGAKIFHQRKIEDELKKYPLPGLGLYPSQPPSLGIIDPFLPHWLMMEAYLGSKYFNHDEPGEDVAHSIGCKRAFFFAGCNAFSSGKLDLNDVKDCIIDCSPSKEENTESMYVRFYSLKGDIEIPSFEERAEKMKEQQKNKKQGSLIL